MLDPLKGPLANQRSNPVADQAGDAVVEEERLYSRIEAAEKSLQKYKADCEEKSLVQWGVLQDLQRENAILQHKAKTLNLEVRQLWENQYAQSAQRQDQAGLAQKRIASAEQSAKLCNQSVARAESEASRAAQIEVENAHLAKEEQDEKGRWANDVGGLQEIGFKIHKLDKEKYALLHHGQVEGGGYASANPLKGRINALKRELRLQEQDIGLGQLLDEERERSHAQKSIQWKMTQEIDEWQRRADQDDEKSRPLILDLRAALVQNVQDQELLRWNLNEVRTQYNRAQQELLGESEETANLRRRDAEDEFWMRHRQDRIKALVMELRTLEEQIWELRMLNANEVRKRAAFKAHQDVQQPWGLKEMPGGVVADRGAYMEMMLQEVEDETWSDFNTCQQWFEQAEQDHQAALLQRDTLRDAVQAIESHLQALRTQLGIAKASLFREEAIADQLRAAIARRGESIPPQLLISQYESR